jgi:hypothetical protein
MYPASQNSNSTSGWSAASNSNSSTNNDGWQAGSGR